MADIEAPPQPLPPLRARLERLCGRLTAGLVERDSVVRLALLAALAGEHVLLFGPPGTAKSEIARRICAAFAGATSFERLLTRFTVPEELFGPLSIRALERDVYHRLTAGYLPTATVAFLDEIFKANSAILNSLLGILNERRFDNGAERVEVPLICLVGASNEVPETDELHALHDRFLVRCHVQAVTEDGFDRLLQLGSSGPRPMSRDLELTLEDVARIREGSERVELSPGAESAIKSLRRWLAEKKIPVSDRRWLKIVKLLKVAAHCEGRMTVLLPDCWLLVHCVCNTPDQIAAVQQWFDARMAEMALEEPSRYQRLTESFERYFEGVVDAPKHARDAEGHLLYHDESGAPVREARARRQCRAADGDLLFAGPKTLGDAASRQARYTSEELWVFFSDDVDAFERYVTNPANALYEEVDRAPVLTKPAPEAAEVAQRLNQLDAVARDLTYFSRAVLAHLDGTATDASLWVPAEVTNKLYASMAGSRPLLIDSVRRIQKLRTRIRQLPSSS